MELPPDPADRTGEEYLAWARSFPLDSPFTAHTRPAPPHPRLADQFPRRPVPLYSRAVTPAGVLPASGVLDHSIDLLTRYAGDDEPFLLVASFLEQHWPYILPEPYATMYDPADVPPWPNFTDEFTNKPGANQALREHFGVSGFGWAEWAPVVAHYLGMATFVDHLVGRLLDALEDLGLAGNTVVLATADHGDLAGSHGLFNKGPVMYEEAYHIPFIWRGPGIHAGESAALTGLIDVCPTIVDLAGVDLAGVDLAATRATGTGASRADRAEAGVTFHGRSLRRMFGGNEAAWRDALMAEFHGDEFGLYSQRMVRMGRFKLVYNAHDVRELYDLEADPGELTNLAQLPEFGVLRLDLEARLYELMHESADPLCRHAANVLG